MNAHAKLLVLAMRFVPWNAVRSWHCFVCGICCIHYDVILKLPEWLSIIRNFGVAYTTPSVHAKFALSKKADGSCVFLRKRARVLDKSNYGKPTEAVYYYGKRRLFIYVDSVCKGLRFGVPTPEFTYSTVPEFIEIAFGMRQKQFKSTAFL